MSSKRDRDDEDAREDLKQGLGLLWRAARKTAGDLRKDLDRSDVGKAIDDAGRELVRAASNVVGRLGAELKKTQSRDVDEARAGEQGSPEDGADGAPKPPAGPTPEDPGFRIAVDDLPKKDDPGERR